MSEPGDPSTKDADDGATDEASAPTSDGSAPPEPAASAPAHGAHGDAPAAGPAAPPSTTSGGGATEGATTVSQPAAEHGAASDAPADGPAPATSRAGTPASAPEGAGSDEAKPVPVAARLDAAASRRNVLVAAGAAVGLAVVCALAVGGYGAWIARDEERRWSAASAEDTEAGWQRYVSWADEVRDGGGLRSMLATELTLIWSHAPVAADALLVSRAGEAIGREDWPAVCAIVSEHPGTRAEARARSALRERLDRGATLYTSHASTYAMRPRALVAARAALGLVREESPCEGAGALRIRHTVETAGADAASRDLDHTIPGGSRSVRALLEADDRDVRTRAIADAIESELGTALSGVYGLRLEAADAAEHAPGGARPHLEVELECTLHPHLRFLTGSGTELPGLALRATVRFFVRDTGAPTVGPPDYETVADIVLPADAALELDAARDAEAIEAIYGRMLADLYARAADRLRMELGLMAWASPAAGGLCDDLDPLQPGRVVRGTTRDGGDATWGSCTSENETYEAYENCYDCGYDGYDEDPPSNPEVAYRLVVAERSRVAVQAVGEDGNLSAVTYVRTSCSDMSSEVACSADEGVSTAIVEPGVYYVFVDGTYGSEGRYTLAASVHDVARAPEACRAPPTLVPGVAATGTTAGGSDGTEASCGGVGAPERAYTLDVPAPSRVRCALASDAAALLSIRSACGDVETELACGLPTLAGLRTRLPAGAHAVLVDGSNPGERGGFTLTCELAPDAGGGDVAADTCASAGALAGSGVVNVDTFAARDDLRGSCAAAAGGPDLVYRIEAAGPTHLRAAPGGAVPPLVYVQRTCGEASSEVACVTSGVLDVDLEPGTSYLVVDGSSGAAWGAGSVEVALTDLSEACGAAVPAVRGPSAGTTRGTSSVFRGTCGGAGPEAIYTLTLESRSHVVVRSQQTFNGVVYLRRDCADWRSELGCSDSDAGHSDRSLVDLTLDSGTYTIFVDGSSADARGTFTLDVTVEAAVTSLR